MFLAHHEKGLMIALALTVMYLFVAPAIIRIPVWLSNSYYPFGESVLMDSSGNLVDNPSNTLNSYHFWPWFIYFAGMFLQITGLPNWVLLKYFPILIISLCALLVYLTLRVKVKATHATLGAGLFLASFWLRQHYFGPPGLGYIFFLLGVLIISRLFFSKLEEKRSLAALFMFVFIATTLTHVLSAFMLVAVLIALYLAHRFARKQTPGNLSILCFFSATFFLAYNMFFAGPFFRLTVRTFSAIFSLSRGLGLFREPSRVAGSAAQVLNYRSTIAIMLIIGGVALVGMLFVLKSRFSRKRTPIDTFSMFWALFSVFLLLFAVGAEYGPHEAYQRAFMFGLVPLVYFCVIALSRKTRLLSIVILVLLFLNIPAQYGADSYTLARGPILSGAYFFAFRTPQNVSCFYEFSLEIRYYNPQKEVKFVILAALPFTSVPNASEVNRALNEADYVVISDQQSNYYYYFLHQNPIDQVDLNRFNRLYDNDDFRVLRQANATSLP